MTLTQLSAFVFVARLGSVKAAARALGVSEPAVSQALGALRQRFGDPLVTRGGDGMTLTEGGRRLLGIAAQMVALGAEAEAAVRSGRPERLHLVVGSELGEFVAGPLGLAYAARRAIEVTSGVATSGEMPLLLSARLADVALGPPLSGSGLVCEPVLRCRMIAVGAPGGRRDTWLVDPSGTDPGSDAARLLRRLRIPEDRVRVFANQAVAWDAAADGAGVAPAVGHLVTPRLRRGDLTVVETAATPMDACWYASTLVRTRRSGAAGSLLDFLTTPPATQVMLSPAAGVPRARFRPTVRVSIWD